MSDGVTIEEAITRGLLAGAQKVRDKLQLAWLVEKQKLDVAVLAASVNKQPIMNDHYWQAEWNARQAYLAAQRFLDAIAG